MSVRNCANKRNEDQQRYTLKIFASQMGRKQKGRKEKADGKTGNRCTAACLLSAVEYLCFSMPHPPPIPLIAPEVGDRLLLNTGEVVRVTALRPIPGGTRRVKNNCPYDQTWVNVKMAPGGKLVNSPGTPVTFMYDGISQMDHTRWVVAHNRGTFLLAVSDANTGGPMIYGFPAEMQERTNAYERCEFAIHHLAQKIVDGLVDIDSFMEEDCLWGPRSMEQTKSLPRLAVYLDVYMRKIELRKHLDRASEWMTW